MQIPGNCFTLTKLDFLEALYIFNISVLLPGFGNNDLICLLVPRQRKICNKILPVRAQWSQCSLPPPDWPLLFSFWEAGLSSKAQGDSSGPSSLCTAHIPTKKNNSTFRLWPIFLSTVAKSTKIMIGPFQKKFANPIKDYKRLPLWRCGSVSHCRAPQAFLGISIDLHLYSTGTTAQQLLTKHLSQCFCNGSLSFFQNCLKAIYFCWFMYIYFYQSGF